MPLQLQSGVDQKYHNSSIVLKLIDNEYEYFALQVEVVPRFAQNRLRITINRRPALIQKTLLAPFAIMSVLPCFAFMLPPDSEAKLDMMLSTMLSYAVYMMILNDYIPPFVQGSSPIIRKYTCTSISKICAEGKDWIVFILPIL